MRWLAALLLAVPLTGCAASAADDGRLQVTAGFYPLVWVAERVGGEHVDVTGLTDPGVEPHDIEPTFARTVALARADLVVVRARPPAGRRRGRRAERRGSRAGRDRRGRPARGGTARPTRTSGSTRCCSPTPATRWPRTWPSSTRPNAASYAANATALRADLERRSTPSSSPAWPTASDTWSCRATTRSATWGRYGIEVAPDRRPHPRRRADAGRPGPAPAADPRARASPRSSPSGWPARS